MCMCMSVSHKLHLFLTPANKEENGKFWPCAKHFINLECNIDTKANHHRKYGHEEVLQQSWDNQTTCLKTETKIYILYTQNLRTYRQIWINPNVKLFFFYQCIACLGKYKYLAFRMFCSNNQQKISKTQSSTKINDQSRSNRFNVSEKKQKGLYLFIFFFFTCSKSKNLMWILINFIFITPQIT